MLKIDIRKAFDRLTHDWLLDTLEEAQVPRFLAAAYVRQVRTAQLQLTLPGSIGIAATVRPQRGVLQGHCLSPLIFVSCGARAVRALDVRLLSEDETKHEDLGIKLDGGRCWGVWFADDAILVARSPRLLKLLLQRVRESLAPTGLEIFACQMPLER